MKKKFLARAVLSVTALGIAVSITSCGGKEEKKSYDALTIPVVQVDGDYFKWNAIEGVTGYVVSIDGVETGIGNPIRNVENGIEIRTDEIGYKECYYALDRTNLTEGTHIFKFASYVEVDGVQKISQWSNAFEIVVSKPETPIINGVNNKSFIVTSTASKLKFVFSSGDSSIVAYYYKDANNVNNVNIQTSDLIFEGTQKLTNGTIYDVEITAETLGFVSNPIKTTMNYDISPDDPKIAIRNNNQLSIVSPIDKVNVKIDDVVTTLKVDTVNGSVFTIDKENFPNVNFVEDKIYTIEVSASNDVKTVTSNLIAYKYTDPNAIEKPVVAVNANNQLTVNSTELDLTFNFNDVVATYKNINPGRVGVIDIDDLSFAEEKMLEEGKTYSVTVSATYNGVVYTSIPVVYTYTSEEEEVQIAKPAVVLDETPKFYFEKKLSNPVINIKLDNDLYTVKLDGQIQQFDLEKYIENHAEDEDAIKMRQYVVEHRDVNVSINVNNTSNVKELASEYSDIVTYNYKLKYDDLIKAAYNVEIADDNETITITDTSTQYYFADYSYVKVTLNNEVIPVYTKTINDNNTVLLYNLKDYLRFGENQIEIDAGINNVNEKVSISSKYFTVFPKVDDIRIEGSKIVWNSVEYATGYMVTIVDNSNSSTVTKSYLNDDIIEENGKFSFDTRKYTSSNDFTVKVYAKIGTNTSLKSSDISVKRLTGSISINDEGESINFSSNNNSYDVGVDILVDDVILGSVQFDHNAVQAAQQLSKSDLFDNIEGGKFTLRAYIKGNNVDYVDSSYEEYNFKLTDNLTYTIEDGVKIKLNTTASKVYVNSNIADSNKTIYLDTDKAFDLIDGYVNELEQLPTTVKICEIGSFSKSAVNEINKPRTINLNTSRVASQIVFKNYDNDTNVVSWNEIYLSSYDVLITGPNDKVVGSFKIDNSRNAKFNISNYLTAGFGYYTVKVRARGNGDLFTGKYSTCIYAYYDKNETISDSKLNFNNKLENNYTQLEIKKSVNRHYKLEYNYDSNTSKYSNSILIPVTVEDPTDNNLDLTIDKIMMNFSLNNTRIRITAIQDDYDGVVIFKNYSKDVVTTIDLYETKVDYLGINDKVYYSLEEDIDEMLYAPEYYGSTFTAMVKSTDNNNNKIISYTSYNTSVADAVTRVQLYDQTNNGNNVKYKVSDLLMRNENILSQTIGIKYIVVPVDIDLYDYLDKYIPLSDNMDYYYDANSFEKVSDNSKSLSHKNIDTYLYVNNIYHYITLNATGISQITATNKKIITADKVVLKYLDNTDHNIAYTPTLADHKFVGWFTLDGEKYKSGKIKNDIELAAKFEDIYHTITFNSLTGKNNVLITFDPNYDFDTPVRKVYGNGDSVDFDQNLFTRDGYIFAGYTLDKEGTELFDFNTTITSDITLYAKWVEEPSYSTLESLSTSTHNSKATAYKFNLYETTEENPYCIYIYVEKDVTNATINLATCNENGALDGNSKYKYSYGIINLTTGATIKTGVNQSYDYYNFTLSAKAGDVILVKFIGGYDSVGKAAIYVTGFENSDTATVTFNANDGLKYTESTEKLQLKYAQSDVINFTLTPTREGFTFNHYEDANGNVIDLSTITKLDKDMTLTVFWDAA